jgi:hypothetical protein
MNKSKTWNNIEGKIYVECGFVEDYGTNLIYLMDGHSNKILPVSLSKEIKKLFSDFDVFECFFEIIIPFVSSGYSDPGVRFSAPENCYPPEYNDERSLSDNCIIVLFCKIKDGFVKIPQKVLSTETSKELFEFYREQIEDEELDFEPYEYDYESDYADKYYTKERYY